MYELIDGFDDRTVAIRATGKVTGADYEQVLTPAVRRATEGGGKARLYVELGTGFEGYEPSGIFADAGLGFGHLGAFERMAIVTDVHWIRDALGLFGGLVPGEVRVFPVAEAEAAQGWIRE